MVLVGLLCSSVGTGSQVLHGDFFSSTNSCCMWLPVVGHMWVVFSTATGGSKQTSAILFWWTQVWNSAYFLCTFFMTFIISLHVCWTRSFIIIHSLNSRISITDDLIFIHEPGCACGLNGLFSYWMQHIASLQADAGLTKWSTLLFSFLPFSNYARASLMISLNSFLTWCGVAQDLGYPHRLGLKLRLQTVIFQWLMLPNWTHSELPASIFRYQLRLNW